MSINPSVSLLEEHPIFLGLSSEQLERFLEAGVERDHSAREVFVEQDTPVQSMCIITAGRSQVFLAGADGREQSISLLSAGAVFGETALFEVIPFTFSVRALTDVKLLAYAFPILMQLCGDHPKAMLQITRNIGAGLLLGRS